MAHLRQVIARVISLSLVLFLAACTTLPPGANQPKPASVAFAHPEQTALGQQFDAQAIAHQNSAHQPLSGFRMLAVGADGFAVRMQMLAAAQHSLDLQYYIFTADSTGLLVTKAILDAADRGVHVRILIDDGSRQPGDEQIEVLAAHPQIEVRMFNPLFYRGQWLPVRALEYAFNVRRLDYRMHNKLFVADNAIALVGGRNIGDEYFQISPDAQVADDDVFVAGPIVRDLSSTFDEFWNSQLAIPVQALHGGKPAKKKLARHRQRLAAHWEAARISGAEYLKLADAGNPLAGIVAGTLPLHWAAARVVCDSPAKRELIDNQQAGRLMYGRIADAVNQVQNEFTMITPYLIPSSEELQLLHDLRKRKVRVRILTNSLNSTNELSAHSGYIHYRQQLVADGVELYEVRAQLGSKSRGSGQSRAISRYGTYGLHAKLLVFDHQSLYAGSMNFDQRSHRLNTEVGVIIDSPAMAEQSLNRFKLMTEPSSAYTVSEHPGKDGKPQLFWRTQEGGALVEYTREPSRSAWRRIEVGFLAMLPIEAEL